MEYVATYMCINISNTFRYFPFFRQLFISMKWIPYSFAIYSDIYVKTLCIVKATHLGVVTHSAPPHKQFVCQHSLVCLGKDQ